MRGEAEPQVGRTYAARIENGIYLEPAIYLGRALYEYGPRDPRNFRRKAFAREERDGYWLPTRVWDVRMSWEDYLALPQAERPR